MELRSEQEDRPRVKILPLFLLSILVLGPLLSVLVVSPSIQPAHAVSYLVDAALTKMAYDPNRLSTWFSNGLYWVFYIDNTPALVYKTSVDGSTWSAKTTVTTSGMAMGGGNQFSTWVNGTDFWYVVLMPNISGDSTFYLRHGTMNSDGSITWAISEVSHLTDQQDPLYPTILADSSTGYGWVAFSSNDLISTFYLEVWEYHGSWSLSHEVTSANFVLPTFSEFPNHHLAVFYATTGGGPLDVMVSTTGGASWNAPVATATTDWGQGKTVMVGTTLHAQGIVGAGSVYHISYTEGGGWAARASEGFGVFVMGGPSAGSGFLASWSGQMTGADVDSYTSNNGGNTWSGPSIVATEPYVGGIWLSPAFNGLTIFGSYIGGTALNFGMTMLPRTGITIDSDPSALPNALIINGTTYTGPQTPSWVAGTHHNLTATRLLTIGGVQYGFGCWGVNASYPGSWGNPCWDPIDQINTSDIVTAPTHSTTYTTYYFTATVSANSTSKPVGGGIALTITANRNVGPTPYSLLLVDITNHTNTGGCGGTTCTFAQTSRHVHTEQYMACVGPGDYSFNCAGSVANSSLLTVSWTAAPVTVIVETNPVDLPNALIIDGTTYSTTTAFSWPLGSTHNLTAMLIVIGPAFHVYTWNHWSMGGTHSQLYTVVGSATLVADYTAPSLSSCNGAGHDPFKLLQNGCVFGTVYWQWFQIFGPYFIAFLDFFPALGTYLATENIGAGVIIFEVAIIITAGLLPSSPVNFAFYGSLMLAGLVAGGIMQALRSNKGG